MRSCAEAGHEVGIHCYDHVKWQDFVAHGEAEWTRRELDRAVAAFERAFFDAARLSQRFFAIPEAQWAGDYGLGLELGLGPVLVLRYNVARTTDFEEINPRVDHEFFLGWNF